MKRTRGGFLRRASMLVVVAAGASASVEGCKSQKETAEAPSSSGVVLASNVRILTDDEAARVTVQPDGLLFPADMTWALSLPVGTILVSGYKDGFLRRVTSASTQTAPKAAGLHPQDLLGTVVSVLTDIGALDDAIVSGTFDSGDLSSDGVNIDVAKYLGSPFTKAELSLAPTGHVTGQIGGSTLRSFVIHVTSTNKLSAAATLTVSESNKIDAEQDVFTSPAYRWVFFIGPLPVVLVGHVKVAMGGHATLESSASLGLQASCTQNLDASIVYDGSQWTAPMSAPWSCEVPKPSADVDATATLDVYDRFRFDLKLYGVAGPSVETRAGVTEVAHASVVTGPDADKLCPLKIDWSIDGYVSAAFAIDVKSLARKTQPWSWPLPEVKIPVASGKWPDALTCAEDAGPDAGLCSAGETQCGGPSSGQCCNDATEQCCATAAPICCPKTWSCNPGAGGCQPPADGGPNDAGGADAADAGADGEAGDAGGCGSFASTGGSILMTWGASNVGGCVTNTGYSCTFRFPPFDGTQSGQVTRSDSVANPDYPNLWTFTFSPGDCTLRAARSEGLVNSACPSPDQVINVKTMDCQQARGAMNGASYCCALQPATCSLGNAAVPKCPGN